LVVFSNTLQAIAAGYLVSTVLLLTLRPAGQLIMTAILLLGYWGLLMLVPFPGREAGVLTPESNLALYIDKLILGSFEDGTTYTWILSCMTFTATVMMGAFAGQILRSGLGKIRKTLFLLAAGIACYYLGWAWGLVFPIIKHLWTSSMVLYAGGISLVLLAIFYFVIDVLRLRFLGFFFVVIGMNAIAVYMVTRVFNFGHLADILVAGLARWTGDWQEFIRNVWSVTIIWLILHYMYRKKTFIKI
jgi:predicted acyltransferase